ncbi:hypothetical protein, partial [Pseudomonas protegens]|uniref:hypothetical protein n=1 Tax=Pseudomonas protegens TaxID=380021 RepID=UPI0011CE50F4
VSRCTETESGVRMIDAILTNSLLPDMSREFLNRMLEGRALAGVRISQSDNELHYDFSEPACPHALRRSQLASEATATVMDLAPSRV